MALGVEVYLSLGSNIAPRGVYLEAMRREIAERFGGLRKVSSIYETAPWGFTAELPFLNQVVQVCTSKSPEEVLNELQQIEYLLGRRRSGGGYASRTADIDILLYGEEKISTERLRIPHPHMAERRFVLAPLAEIAGDWQHGGYGKSWRELLKECRDAGEVVAVDDPATEERERMVRLIADGGATTAKWKAIDTEGNVCWFTTRGLNPLYVNDEEVAREVQLAFGTEDGCRSVGRVSFYGASCGPNQQGEVLQKGLQKAFPLAEVHVDSDMVLASLSTWGAHPVLPKGERAVVAILGTGSNACYIDAGRPVYVTPSLGFLFGDEGSGAWFGKRLVRDWLYGVLPKCMEKDVRRMLEEEFGEVALQGMESQETIVNRVYHGAQPSAWFGSFARVMGAHRGEEYVERLLAEGFGAFGRFFLEPLKAYGGVEVRAVGSVAWYYRDALRTACESVGMRLGKVVRDPLEGIAQGGEA